MLCLIPIFPNCPIFQILLSRLNLLKGRIGLNVPIGRKTDGVLVKDEIDPVRLTRALH